MHTQYTVLHNRALDLFSIILHSDRVEDSFSLHWDVIGWRQSKTTDETLPEKVVVRQIVWSNIGIKVGADPELDTMNTENDSEMKKQVEVVLPTGPGNPPAVRVWIGKTVRFGSGLVQKPDPQLLGRRNSYLYPSNRGVLPGWSRPVGSNLLISFLGFSISGCSQICYCDVQNIN